MVENIEKHQKVNVAYSFEVTDSEERRELQRQIEDDKISVKSIATQTASRLDKTTVLDYRNI